VFSRRSKLEDVAEQHLGVALPFAFIGIAAGLIGSLPDLHRGLQAFLLGYVAAGFAGVLSALGYVVLGQRDAALEP
jgi:hypothetical protein